MTKNPCTLLINNIYSSKKICTTHCYFFVFKTFNTCEIWKNDLAKLKFSENVFSM